MAQSMTQGFATPPTGVTARFFGSVPQGVTFSTTRYYWVQAIYPQGRSGLTSASVASTPASLDNNNRVLIEWNAMSGAIGYNVFYTTSATAPTNGAILIGTVTGTGLSDVGLSNSPMTGFVTVDGFLTTRAHYDFAVDGGGAPGLITIAQSDTIPAGAIIVGAILNSTVAFVGATATIAVGTSAGSAANSIKTATAVASYSLDALLNGTVTFAAAVKMTAAGTLTMTTATAALTAGVMDIIVLYVMPINL